MADPAEDSVWIRTAPTVDGSGYVVTVEASADRAVVLTPDRALRYASAVLGAVQRAEYDAAVVRQLTAVLSDKSEAARMVIDLRGARPPLDVEATAPLAVEPGVNSRHEPFLHLRVDGELDGQWTLPDARQHALTVLEAVGAADLDSGYYRALRGSIGLEEGEARAVVEDVAKWRPADV